MTLEMTPVKFQHKPRRHRRALTETFCKRRFCKRLVPIERADCARWIADRARSAINMRECVMSITHERIALTERDPPAIRSKTSSKNRSGFAKPQAIPCCSILRARPARSRKAQRANAERQLSWLAHREARALA